MVIQFFKIFFRIIAYVIYTCKTTDFHFQEAPFELYVVGKTSKDYENRTFSEINHWTDSARNDAIGRSDIMDFEDEGFLLHRLLTAAECKHYIQQGEDRGFEVIDESARKHRSSNRYNNMERLLS